MVWIDNRTEIITRPKTTTICKVFNAMKTWIRMDHNKTNALILASSLATKFNDPQQLSQALFPNKGSAYTGNKVSFIRKIG